ncbi:MAG: phosphoesterase, family [Deltaproteobacteria bacterium]|nr:phosphoesterase, family [Deltaproteobacteria bacterium]
MKIAVISDTHLTHPTDTFRRHMKTFFGDAEIMLHAGDMTSSSVFDYLCNWDLRAVRGNMDDHDLRAALPEQRIETIAGRRIGLIHGWGSPKGLEDRVLNSFSGVDIIIFGHSHVPFNMTSRGVTLFNPGSYRGGYAGKGSVGIIEISEELTFHHIVVEHQ